MEPTEFQKNIIKCEGNVVVLASPGSGKTFVLSEKIRRVLKDKSILAYQGIIAISYTRKASDNLKKRTIGNGMSCKNSFFGTIDNFCLTQIINCYGYYVFGHPVKELQVIDFSDLNKLGQEHLNWIKSHPDYNKIGNAKILSLQKLFLKGYVLVESLELLALHIINKSDACRRYIKARYKYVFIDEYQDADTYTNELFLFLIKLGMTGVAVGDENQSIFGFAKKSSTYLKALKDNKDFKTFRLSENFRCSIPIINYSNRLLDQNSQTYKTDREGVYLVRVNGSEKNISDFIDNELDKIKRKFKVIDNNEIAILVKNDRTQRIIDASLKTPHRFIRTTRLDLDLNPRSRLFALLLYFYFDEKISFLSVLDEYVDYDMLSIFSKQRLHEECKIIKSIEEENICELTNHFNKIADIVLPKVQEGFSRKKLKEVLDNKTELDSYKPLLSDEIQLMTLHKSKGLEFDIVFHLNMCEWILPFKKVEDNDFYNPLYPNWEQDLNLHYVGITRARKACYLVRGTQRRNSENCLKNAKDSEFLSLNELTKLRKDIWYDVPTDNISH